MTVSTKSDPRMSEIKTMLDAGFAALDQVFRAEHEDLQVQLRLDPVPEPTEIVPGLTQIADKVFQSFGLNLFADGADQEQILQKIDQYSEEGPGISMRCRLDQIPNLSQEHIVAYVNLALLYPKMLFQLEVSTPELFLGIFPNGVPFPENVVLGSTASDREEWHKRTLALLRVCTFNRYMRLVGFEDEISLQRYRWDPDTGNGLAWVIVSVDSGENIARVQDSLSLLLMQLRYWDTPLYLEGAVCDPSVNDEGMHIVGEFGRQFPLPSIFRLTAEEDGGETPAPMNLQVSFQDGERADTMDPKIGKILKLCKHAEYVSGQKEVA